MTTGLEGPRAKIQRAKKHVLELEAVHQRFAETKPYDLRAEKEPDTEHLVQYAVIRADPPLEMNIILGDAIHNLRASLDLLMWQLVEANGLTPDRNDAFPIYGTQRDFEAALKGRVKTRIASEPAQIIEALKPYKGGNGAFWVLHKLDIVDKHRTILTAPASVQQVLMKLNLPREHIEALGWDSDEIPELPPIGIRPADRNCPLKDGDEVLRFPEKEFEHYKGTKILIQIAIHEPGIIECEPLLPFLADIGSSLEKIVELFAPFLKE